MKKECTSGKTICSHHYHLLPTPALQLLLRKYTGTEDSCIGPKSTRKGQERARHTCASAQIEQSWKGTANTKTALSTLWKRKWQFPGFRAQGSKLTDHAGCQMQVTWLYSLLQCGQNYFHANYDARILKGNRSIPHQG